MIIKKKSTGLLDYCFDYTKLNEIIGMDIARKVNKHKKGGK